MPIYEYICNKCEKPKEIITFSISEKINTECECGGELIKKISGGFGFKISGNPELTKTKTTEDENVIVTETEREEGRKDVNVEMKKGFKVFDN